MKLDKKKIIVLIIIIVLLIIGIFVFLKNNETKENTEQPQVLVQTLEDGTKLNTSNKLKETKKIGNIEISNSQLTNKDGKTTLLADVKNVGNTKIEMLELEIVFIDRNNKQIGTLLNGLLGTIESGEVIQLNVSSTNDYSEVYNYLVRVK